MRRSVTTDSTLIFGGDHAQLMISVPGGGASILDPGPDAGKGRGPLARGTGSCPSNTMPRPGTSSRRSLYLLLCRGHQSRSVRQCTRGRVSACIHIVKLLARKAGCPPHLRVLVDLLDLMLAKLLQCKRHTHKARAHGDHKAHGASATRRACRTT